MTHQEFGYQKIEIEKKIDQTSKSNALSARANFSPPKTAPKTLFTKPKAAIFNSFVMKRASRFTPIMTAIKTPKKITPAGGIGLSLK